MGSQGGSWVASGRTIIDKVNLQLSGCRTVKELHCKALVLNPWGHDPWWWWGVKRLFHISDIYITLHL